VLVTFAWGCGPQSQSDRVKATVNSFFAGLGHPSGSLCDLLSASYVKRRNGAGGAVGLARCRRKAEAAAASGRKVSVSRVVFNDVKVSGSTATVNVSSSQGDLHLTLVNEGGGWKIDSGL
jgi:hypothetical protein